MNNRRNDVHLIARNLLGDNIALSFPVPAVENGVKVEKRFVYRMSFNSSKTRPFAVIVTSITDGNVLAFINSHYMDFVNTADYPFDKKISYDTSDSSIGAKQLKALLEELDSLYKEFRDAVFGDALTDLQKEAVAKYKEIFDKVTPAALVPYYHALNNQYFEWLGTAAV